MADPFLGEMRIFSFEYAPTGWALCNGQFLPINQNQALFSLLGTAYGGNGQTTFALPDLRGRVPLHFEQNGSSVGERFGETAHTLTVNELPMHVHVANGTTTAASAPTPAGNVLAAVDPTTFGNSYSPPAGLVALAAGTVSNVGGSQPHPNEMPYLVLNVCIALTGIFPSRN